MKSGDVQTCRIKKLVEQYVQSKRRGDSIAASDFVRANPDIANELSKELHQTDLLLFAFNESERDAQVNSHNQIEVAKSSRDLNQQEPSVQTSEGHQLRVRCPECQSGLDVLADTPWTSITCGSCNSAFSLVGHDEHRESGFSKINQYQLLERLGVGGFGTVWKAHDTALDRLAAIKIPRKSDLSSIEAEHFLREARACAQFQHPNIVNVFEVGKFENQNFIASKYIEGCTLAEQLVKKQPTITESVGLSRTVADALQTAHEAGVVHRDLKPGNILIDHNGQPHISDFGLAKREFGDITMTIDGAVLGTPAFMSPEQASGRAHSADSRSDIYSLGVILYRMLTDEIPFRGSTATILSQVINDVPTSPRKLNQRVPLDLETICLKCLEKSPDRRFQSAADVRDELDRFIDGRPIVSRPVGAIARAIRLARRWPLVSSLLATIFGILIFATLLSSYWATLANQSSKRLADSLHMAECRVYAAEMNRVQHAVDQGDTVTAMYILNSFIPKSDEFDYRMFEWNYWSRRCRENQLAIHQASQRGTAVDFAGNAELLAWADGNGQVYISDIELRKPKPCSEPHTEMVNDLAFSNDSSILASCSDDGDVKFWNASDGSVADTWHIGGVVWQIAWWRNGTAVVAVVEDEDEHFLIARDFKTGTIFYRRAIESGSFFRLRTVDDQEKLLVHSTHNKWLSVFSTEKDRPIWTIRNKMSRICLMTQLDEFCIVTKDDNRQDILQFYDLATGRLKKETLVDPQITYASRIEFLCDRNEWAIATSTGKIVLIDKSGSQQAIFTGHQNRILDIAISPDGRKLSSVGDDGSVRVWNLDHKRENPHVVATDDSQTQYLKFSVDGKKLLSCGYSADGNSINARIWSIPDFQLMECVSVDDGNGIPSSNSDLSLVAITSRVDDESAWSVSFWDNRKEKNRKLTSHAFEGAVRLSALAFSPDSEQFAMADEGDSEVWPGQPAAVKLWKINHSNDSVRLVETKRLGGESGNVDTSHHSNIIQSVFSPDGRWLATSGRERSLKVWSTTSGELKYSRIVPRTTSVLLAMDISPDSHWLASGSSTGDVIVRRFSDGKLIHNLRHADEVRDVKFMRDSRTLASASHDRTVKLWDVATGQLRTTFKAKHPIVSLATSESGTYLAAGDTVGNIYLWDGRAVEWSHQQ